MMCGIRVGRCWMLLALAIPLTVASLSARKGDGTLIKAVKDGDAPALRAALRTGDDVNATEADGATALHWAVQRNDMAMVDQLLRAGANVKAANRYGVAPLSLAAENGDAAIVERLLKAGADPNTTQFKGETALMTAARTGKPDAVKVLLAHGANVNAAEHTHQQTALMWAANEGNSEALRILIEAGADVHARSVSPPDNLYGLYGSGGTASGLTLKRPANYGAFTPLMFAVRTGHLEAVRLLLDAGADVNAKATVLRREEGPSNVLMLAVANANYEVASLLVDRGADVKAADTGWTALHTLAMGRSQPGKHRGAGGFTAGPTMKGNMSGLDLAKKFVAHGANVNAQSAKQVWLGYRLGGIGVNRIGATPFLLAAKAGDYEMMRTLAALGADPHLRTVDGVTAMMTAAGIGNKAGSDDGGNEEAVEAVKVCIELGADINAVDVRGWTALHAAVFRGYVPLVKYLVDQGARLDLKTKPGSFPLDPGLTPRGLASGGRVSARFIQWPDIITLLGDAMRAKGVPDAELEAEVAAGIARRAVEEDDPRKTGGGYGKPVTVAPKAK